jgi:hypothetical protein
MFMCLFLVLCQGRIAGSCMTCGTGRLECSSFEHRAVDWLPRIRIEVSSAAQVARTQR